jgi:hypothetical protein
MHVCNTPYSDQSMRKYRAARRATSTYRPQTQCISMFKLPYTPHGPFSRPSNV